MGPADKIRAILAGCAAAAVLLVSFEGWAPKTYLDPVAVPTACAGVTADVVAGRTYSDAECIEKTATAMVEHGAGIAKCLPDQLPDDTRAAFTSFAYNVGVANFCGSTLAKKARAGDLAGACAELSRWVYAGGKKFNGLVRRRAAERALCEKGLA